MLLDLDYGHVLAAVIVERCCKLVAAMLVVAVVAAAVVDCVEYAKALFVLEHFQQLLPKEMKIVVAAFVVVELMVTSQLVDVEYVVAAQI